MLVVVAPCSDQMSGMAQVAKQALVQAFVLQAIAGDEAFAAQHPLVVHMRLAVRLQETGSSFVI